MIFLLRAPLSWDHRHTPAAALNPDSLENLQANGKVNEDQEREEEAQLAEQACKRPGVDSAPFTSARCTEMCCNGQGVTVGGCAAMEKGCRSGWKLFLPREVSGDVEAMLCSWPRRNTEVTPRPKDQK